MALALGYASPRRMLRELTAAELEGWRQYAAAEPFGPERDDLRFGVVASTFANVFRDKKQKQEPFEPSDFVLRRAEDGATKERPGKTPQQMLQFVEAVNLALGGYDRRRRNRVGNG